MKRLICVFLALVLILAFSSCGRTQDGEGEKLNSSNTLQNSSTEIKNNVVPYPILFIDMNSYENKAFILCSVEENEIFLTDKYMYNDKPLSEYLNGEETLVESSIIDSAKKLSFFDSKGNCFEVNALGLYCNSKDRVIDGEPAIIVELSKNIESDEDYLIGTYSDINIFEVTNVLNNNSIVIDLDSDGKKDSVSWEFIDTEDSEQKGYYDYKITVNNESVYTIENDEGLTVDKNDFWVSALDINGDKIKELLVYNKVHSRFGTVSIYQLKDNELTKMVEFPINPMP